jgi:hypothetical protein
MTDDGITVFVFGSNMAGRHGKGAALHARRYFKAKLGVGIGRTGDSYAIPTKDGSLRVLPLDRIQNYVKEFIAYANSNPSIPFLVTRIGCGLAGYTDAEIGPLFSEAPQNCQLPEEWLIYKKD